MMTMHDPLCDACGVDIDILRENITDYLDTELTELKGKDITESKPTTGFQRVLQRAAIHVQSSWSRRGNQAANGFNRLIL